MKPFDIAKLREIVRIAYGNLDLLSMTSSSVLRVICFLQLQTTLFFPCNPPIFPSIIQLVGCHAIKSVKSHIICCVMIQATFTPYSSTTSSLGYCNICYAGYDRHDRKPLIICPQHHTICKSCLVAIKQRPRCPFCRCPLDFERIRVNKQVLEFISGKERKGLQLQFGKSNASRRMDRFITEKTIQEQEEENGEQYLNPAEFGISPQQSVLVPQEDGLSLITKILIYLQLLALQIPLGILSLYFGLQSPNGDCMDAHLKDSNIMLRGMLLTLGYIEMMTGVLTIYFTCSHYLGVVNRQGMDCFNLFLLILVEIKSFFGFIIYTKFMVSDQISACEKGLDDYVVVNMLANDLEMCLGMLLICQLMERLAN